MRAYCKDGVIQWFISYIILCTPSRILPAFRYHLKDVIIGKIYFLLVRIKLKNMDLEIRRRESTGSGANTHVETETLAKFELMDGAPVRGIQEANSYYLPLSDTYSFHSCFCLISFFWHCVDLSYLITKRMI